MEVEEAMRRRKDPRSLSRILCYGKCLTGPSNKGTSAVIANMLNLILIGFNIVMVCYTLKESWIWLCSISIAFGVISSIFMCLVMLSDPGVINRKQDESKLPYLEIQR